MPSMMVYIREADLSKWLAIEKKSEWVHSMLNQSNDKLKTEIAGNLVNAPTTPIIKTPEDAAKAIGIKKETIPMKFCPNGHPIPEGRTKCLGKGCKYS